MLKKAEKCVKMKPLNYRKGCASVMSKKQQDSKNEHTLKKYTEECAKVGRGFFGEFKTFILRGNVLDLAVGVIIGAAFQAIVNSLVKDVIMPIISLITGGIDFSEWFISLNGQSYASLEAAQKAGAATLNYGVFLTAVINFLIMAFVIFLLVKCLNRLAGIKGKKAEEKEQIEEAKTKQCPFCCSEIDIKAVRCPHCTSQLKE